MSTSMSCNLRHYAPRLSDYVTLLYLAVNITSSTIGLLQLLAMYAQAGVTTFCRSSSRRLITAAYNRVHGIPAHTHTHTHTGRGYLSSPAIIDVNEP